MQLARHALPVALLLVAGACGVEGAGPPQEEPMSKLDVASTAFDANASIPARHTCDGGDRSPPLSWSAGPEGTTSYALVMDDPDAPAGTWVHWVAWNVPGTSLPEGLATDAELANGMRQGHNSWGKSGYGGPCPPSGEHRYFFHVWALDAPLELPPSTDAEKLRAALHGHVLASGELMGRYARQ